MAMLKKIYIYIYLIVLCFLGLTQSVQAQNYLRTKKVAFSTLPFSIDSLTIVPSTIFIKETIPFVAKPADIIRINYQLESNLLSFYKDSSLNIAIDSLVLFYRVFPINFSQKYQLYSEHLYDSNYYETQSYRPFISADLLEQREEIFATPGIQKTGSFRRGFTLGNTQDLALNSHLNLQLQGMLSKSLRLKASITDQNIPFQPEGNTQNIQELDEVLIEISHRYGKIRAGDVLLKNIPGYFLKFHKNIMGVQASALWGNEKVNGQTTIGFAQAKGQFNSQWLEPIEGVSGPYRLQGSQNERFITVISNSEKVYVDGKLLERGFNKDYIIDYNTAELTFVNQVLITQFTRIQIDFEYALQNYNRNILQAQHDQQIHNFRLYTSFYREQDDRNQPLLGSLNERDQQILNDLGDSVTLALSAAFDTISVFSETQILYTQKDTLLDGILHENIFVRAKATDSILFNPVFIEVGAANGAYRPSDENINGILYEWFGPGNGNYTAAKILHAPNKRQIFAVGANYRLSDTDSVYAEIAFSDHDANLFANKGDRDNADYAFILGYVAKAKGFGKNHKYQVSGRVSFEYDKQYFRPIDRFRSAEFNLDWSADINLEETDKIILANFRLQESRKNYLAYSFAYRQRGISIDGTQQAVQVQKWLGLLKFHADGFLMNSRMQNTRSQWQKARTGLTVYQKNIRPGYEFSTDRNTTIDINTDSVTSSFRYFNQHTIFVEQGDSTKFFFRADANLRTDFEPIEGSLQAQYNAQTFNFSFRKKQSKNLFNWLLTYRKLKNKLQPQASAEETLTGRIDWNTAWANNQIRSQLTYNTTSSRELRREFRYLIVPQGQGTHTWRDDNGDGTQDLEEFYPALNPDERNYARFFIPTDDYVAAHQSRLSYRLSMALPIAWAKKKGFKRFLSKFSNNTSLLANKKTNGAGLAERFLPFTLAYSADENVLSEKNVFRSALFFNRRSTKFGIQFQTLISTDKQLLTRGNNSRETAEYTLTTRWNISKKYEWRTVLKTGAVDNQSDFLINRNYRISSWEIMPAFSFQPNPQLRLTTSYQYKKSRHIASVERSFANEAGLNLRWSKLSRNALLASFKYTHIDYNGEVNMPIGYELLEALQVGQNFQWELIYNQRLSNGLQLNVSYHGRKSQEQPIIHTGNMQISLLF